MPKYSIGVDFGKISGRAVLVNIENGKIVATSAVDYPRGIMVKTFKNGNPLPDDWALAYPQDYLDILSETIRDVISNVNPADVIGIGIDMSSCCVMPVKANGTPLCYLDEFKDNPYAYASITRNLSAKKQAKRMLDVAREMEEPWLKYYNGKISPEWLFPKILKIIDEAPRVYSEADYFIEVVDWLIWQLTGSQIRNSFSASFKGFYIPGIGYPSKKYLSAVNLKLGNIVDTKLNAPIFSTGELAGNLTKHGSNLIGLPIGTSVSVGVVDLYACTATVKGVKNDAMVGIFGDSGTMFSFSDVTANIKGISGGFQLNSGSDMTVYKAKHNCIGRTYAWFLHNYVKPEYHQEAKEQNRNLYSYIAQKMMRLNAGENGLIALNWLDGNQAVLSNPELSSVIVGMREDTRVEHILRAIVESMAYDTRKLIETYRENGIQTKEFYGVGTFAEKNPFIMQVYSDVLQIPIRVAGTPMSPAIGSAIYGAVAAGSVNGGYDTVREASEAMGCLKNVEYTPNPYNQEIYNQLYAEYCKIYDLFGKEYVDIMTNLKNIKQNAN